MQSIRENQLKRLKIKSDFLKNEGVIPPYIQSHIDGVADLDMARKVGKEVRDKNWPKIEMIEQVIDSFLRIMKTEMTAPGCESCNQCDDKLKIIDELLGTSDVTDLKNVAPIGEC